MKKFCNLHWTTLIKVCTEKTFRILKLATLLFMVTVLNVFGSNTLLKNTNPNLDKATDPVAIMQQNRVTGTVTDKNGPIAGANVVVTGTTQGTITDVAGKYSLDVPQGSKSLTFTFIGMEPQEISIGTLTQINVIMTESAIGLEEVVVIGYGTQKKANLTGSVTSVDGDQLNKKFASQASQLLQGTISGITVTQSSGNPGEDETSLRIRGLGTFSSGENNPLVIVDGFSTDINSINPDDIESISVLKDAASSAIYGSRAANGVILITTKTGKKGLFQVNYESYIGKQEVTELPQYLDSWDFAESVNIINHNQGTGPLYTEGEIEKFKSGEYPDEYPNMQHLKSLFNSGNGLQTKHNLTFSGGSGNTQYLFSAGYLKQNAMIERNYYDRYNMRLNLSSELKKNLKLNVNLSGNISVHEEPLMCTAYGIESFGNVLSLISQANKENATVPGKKSDGTYGTFMGYPTAIAHLSTNSNSNQTHSNSMNIVSLEWNVTNSLKLTGKINYQQNSNNQKDLSTDFEADPLHIYGPIQIQNIVSENNDLILESLIDYDKKFGNHHLHVLGGFNQETYNSKSISGYRKDLQSSKLDELNAGSIGYQKNSGTGETWKLRSYFGRVNYLFKEKYILEGNIRYDGSSRFAKGNRYGLFPSVSAAWRISEEDFFQIPWVEQFKIRSSYGVLGNQQIGTYPYQKVLTSGYVAIIGGEYKDGIGLANLPAEDISWETTNVTDVGSDITVLNGKLNFSVDYFYKRTYDILYNLSVSKVLGMSVGEQNAGEVENKGWDFELVHKSTVGNFSYSINPNFSIVHNKVLKLGNVEKDISKGLFIGESLQSIYGYETDGLFVDQKDIDNYAVQNYTARPGTPRYIDISGPEGKPDGIVSAEYDRTIIGNQFPKYTYGMGITANYKGFDFYVQVQGQGGMENQIGYERLAYSNSYNIQKWQFEERWTEENPDRYAKYPLFLTPNAMAPWGDNLEYWMRNNSFLRIKNVQLGYSLPSKILTHIFIDQFRVYVSGLNIKCFDNYIPGWDPEMPAGINYPPSKLWSIGVNVKF